MTDPTQGRVRCNRCDEFYDIDEGHACPKAGTTVLAAVVVDPAVPPFVRAGTTWRFHVVDHNTLIKRAVLDHEAAPALIGAAS